jgi:hypothetical protein
MQYMLNVQRTLAKATILEVGYVGSQSRRLGYLVNQNQGILNASLPVVQLALSGMGRLWNPVAEWRRQWELQRLQWQVAPAFRREPQRPALLLLVQVPGRTSNIRGMVGSTFSPQDARCPVSCEKAPRISTFRNGSPL